MTNYCPIPGASQPKEPVRLVDANSILRSDSSGSTNVVFSDCNAISFAAYNFCPHCGKGMVNADD